jgi:hypothetical protein
LNTPQGLRRRFFQEYYREREERDTGDSAKNRSPLKMKRKSRGNAVSNLMVQCASGGKADSRQGQISFSDFVAMWTDMSPSFASGPSALGSGRASGRADLHFGEGGEKTEKDACHGSDVPY